MGVHCNNHWANAIPWQRIKPGFDINNTVSSCNSLSCPCFQCWESSGGPQWKSYKYFSSNPSLYKRFSHNSLSCPCFQCWESSGGPPWKTYQYFSSNSSLYKRFSHNNYIMMIGCIVTKYWKSSENKNKTKTNKNTYTWTTPKNYVCGSYLVVVCCGLLLTDLTLILQGYQVIWLCRLH